MTTKILCSVCGSRSYNVKSGWCHDCREHTLPLIGTVTKQPHHDDHRAHAEIAYATHHPDCSCDVCTMGVDAYIYYRHPAEY